MHFILHAPMERQQYYKLNDNKTVKNGKDGQSMAYFLGVLECKRIGSRINNMNAFGSLKRGVPVTFIKNEPSFPNDTTFLQI